MLFRILVIIAMLISKGYTIEYNHVPNFPKGCYTIYFGGECVHDDMQLEDFIYYYEVK